jgi:hypothetical protein
MPIETIQDLISALLIKHDRAFQLTSRRSMGNRRGLNSRTIRALNKPYFCLIFVRSGIQAIKVKPGMYVAADANECPALLQQLTEK